MFYFFDFIREIFRGKSLGRILMNWEIKKRSAGLRGEVLDLASGGGASYDRYLPPQLKVIKTDYQRRTGVEYEIDLNRPLPFPDKSQENIFLFGALYIAENIQATLKELFRIKRDGGALFIALPFIAGEIPEPHDYFRLTQEGLAREFFLAGFSDYEIIRLGGRFSASSNLLHPVYRFNFIRLIAYSFALLFDRLVVKLEKKHPCPLAYFCVIRK